MSGLETEQHNTTITNSLDSKQSPPIPSHQDGSEEEVQKENRKENTNPNSPFPPYATIPPPEGQNLTDALKAQVEMLFTKEYLSRDPFFLVHLQQGNGSVSIQIIQDLPYIQMLTKDASTLLQAIKESDKVVVEEKQEEDGTITYIRSAFPLDQRTTIILREVAEETTEEDIRELFGTFSSSISSLRPDISNTWFISFADEDTTTDAFFFIRSGKKMLKGQPIQARVKSENLLNILTSQSATPNPPTSFMPQMFPPPYSYPPFPHSHQQNHHGRGGMRGKPPYAVNHHPRGHHSRPKPRNNMGVSRRGGKGGNHHHYNNPRYPRSHVKGDYGGNVRGGRRHDGHHFPPGSKKMNGNGGRGGMRGQNALNTSPSPDGSSKEIRNVAAPQFSNSHFPPLKGSDGGSSTPATPKEPGVWGGKRVEENGKKITERKRTPPTSPDASRQNKANGGKTTEDKKREHVKKPPQQAPKKVQQQQPRPTNKQQKEVKEGEKVEGKKEEKKEATSPQSSANATTFAAAKSTTTISYADMAKRTSAATAKVEPTSSTKKGGE